MRNETWKHCWEGLCVPLARGGSVLDCMPPSVYQQPGTVPCVPHCNSKGCRRQSSEEEEDALLSLGQLEL